MKCTNPLDATVQQTIAQHATQDAFLARGLRSAEDTKRTGIYHAAEAVHDELARRLDARRRQLKLNTAE